MAKAAKKTTKKASKKAAAKQPRMQIEAASTKGRTTTLTLAKTDRAIQQDKKDAARALIRRRIRETDKDFKEWMRENIDREEWAATTLEDAVTEFCDNRGVDLWTATDAEWAKAMILVNDTHFGAYRDMFRNIMRDTKTKNQTVAHWLGEK